MTDRDTIEPLVRAIYELTAMQRDIPRLCEFEHPVGLKPLATVHRLAPARVKDVADALHVDLSVASRQVAALADAGYISREPDPDDGRAHRVRVTAAGAAALEHAHRRIVSAFAEALGGWSDGDLTALTAGLTRLRTDYETHAAGSTATSAKEPA